MMKALRSLIRFLRDALSESGSPSFSRTGSAVIVIGYVVTMMRAGKVPDNSEGLAAVLFALYGVNALKAGIAAMRPAPTPQTATDGQDGATNVASVTVVTPVADTASPGPNP